MAELQREGQRFCVSVQPTLRHTQSRCGFGDGQELLRSIDGWRDRRAANDRRRSREHTRQTARQLAGERR
jgi:hypothetical protein